MLDGTYEIDVAYEDYEDFVAALQPFIDKGIAVRILTFHGPAGGGPNGNMGWPLVELRGNAIVIREHLLEYWASSPNEILEEIDEQYRVDTKVRTRGNY